MPRRAKACCKRAIRALAERRALLGIAPGIGARHVRPAAIKVIGPRNVFSGDRLKMLLQHRVCAFTGNPEGPFRLLSQRGCLLHCLARTAGATGSHHRKLPLTER